MSTHITSINKLELFFGTQLNGFKYCNITITIQHQSFVCSLWPIDMTLISCYHSRLEWPGSNGNKRVLHIPEISEAGALSSDCLMWYPRHSLGGGFTPLQICCQCFLLPQLTGFSDITNNDNFLANLFDLLT